MRLHGPPSCEVCRNVYISKFLTKVGFSPAGVRKTNVFGSCLLVCVQLRGKRLKRFYLKKWYAKLGKSQNYCSIFKSNPLPNKWSTGVTSKNACKPKNQLKLARKVTVARRLLPNLQHHLKICYRKIETRAGHRMEPLVEISSKQLSWSILFPTRIFTVFFCILVWSYYEGSAQKGGVMS